MSDLDSDDDVPELAASPNDANSFANGQNGLNVNLDDDRRAHHNALERKRRDHIKDSFSMLREVVPTLKGEKASRALILKKASDYINSLKTNISTHQKDISDLKRQNAMLEKQVDYLEGGNDFVSSLPYTEMVVEEALPVTDTQDVDGMNHSSVPRFYVPTTSVTNERSAYVVTNMSEYAVPVSSSTS